MPPCQKKKKHIPHRWVKLYLSPYVPLKITMNFEVGCGLSLGSLSPNPCGSRQKKKKKLMPLFLFFLGISRWFHYGSWIYEARCINVNLALCEITHVLWSICHVQRLLCKIGCTIDRWAFWQRLNRGWCWLHIYFQKNFCICLFVHVMRALLQDK